MSHHAMPQYDVENRSEHNPSQPTKNEPDINVRAVDVVSNQDLNRAGRWETGFWRRFPVVAVLALLGSLACTIGSVVILWDSHNKPVNNWGYGLAPSVYISTFAVIGNILLGIALVQGLVIRFWRTAMEGCTLEELNRNWLAGQSALKALRHCWGKGGRVTGFAVLVSTLALLRGPLNQRATRVNSGVPYLRNDNMTISIAKELDGWYTGHNTRIQESDLGETSMMTENMTQVMREYTSNQEMFLLSKPCGPQCEATIQAFGFDTTNCSSRTIPWNHTVPFNVDFLKTTVKLCKLENDYFPAGIELSATYYSGESKLQSHNNSGRKDWIAGTLTNKVCILSPGIVAYPVTIINQTIELSQGYRENKFISPIGLKLPLIGGGSTTLGGFQYAGNYLLSSTAQWTYSDRGTDSIIINGSLGNQVAKGVDSTEVEETYNGPSFNDPMPDMLQEMSDIAFRTAVYAANQHEYTLPGALQSSSYFGTDTQNLYSTQHEIMAVAAVIGLINVLAVAATLWGWWELGRNMSFSPIELAKAFSSPLLASMNSNAAWSNMPSEVAKQRVKLGAELDFDMPGTPGNEAHSGSVLAINAEQKVQRPSTGEFFGA